MIRTVGLAGAVNLFRVALVACAQKGLAQVLAGLACEAVAHRAGLAAGGVARIAGETRGSRRRTGPDGEPSSWWCQVALEPRCRAVDADFVPSVASYGVLSIAANVGSGAGGKVRGTRDRVAIRDTLEAKKTAMQTAKFSLLALEDALSVCRAASFARFPVATTRAEGAKGLARTRDGALLVAARTVAYRKDPPLVTLDGASVGVAGAHGVSQAFAFACGR